MANLLGFPGGPDVFTEAQEDVFMELELDFFWGSIARNHQPEPNSMYSTSTHNPTIRYFHKILAHTLLGKEENITSVSRDELFIMFCVFQSQPINVATFMLSNLDRIAQNTNGPILI